MTFTCKERTISGALQDAGESQLHPDKVQKLAQQLALGRVMGVAGVGEGLK